MTTRADHVRWCLRVLLLVTAVLILLVPARAASDPAQDSNGAGRFTLREAAAKTRAADRPRLRPGGAAPPRLSEPYRTTRAVLPDRFREHETRRFVIFSDADERWTRTQAARLERSHHQFLRFARRLGVTPDPLRHKLVCVLFQSRDEYRRFALEQDDVADPRIAGYYAPRHDRVVFYHVESNPSLADARIRLNEIRQQVDDVNRQIDLAVRRGNAQRADALRRTLRQYQDHLGHEQARVDEFADRVSVTTTIHEAIHQLLFHSRLQSRHLQYPLWICEGLATSFETDTPNEAFGPDHEFDSRRKVFNEQLENRSLIRLPQFVTLTEVPDETEQAMSVVYHQSYTLVTWMFRFRRNELRTYLELLRAEPAGVPSAARQLQLFEQAFGDAETLEQIWLRHEQAELGRVGATDEMRRVLLNDTLLAKLSASGALTPESMQRLRRYALTGQTARPPSTGDDAGSEVSDAAAVPSTTVIMSGILED